MTMPIYSWSLGKFIQLKIFLLIQHPGPPGALLIVLRSHFAIFGQFSDSHQCFDVSLYSVQVSTYNYLMRAFCLMSRKIHAYTNMSYC